MWKVRFRETDKLITHNGRICTLSSFLGSNAQLVLPERREHQAQPPCNRAGWELGYLQTALSHRKLPSLSDPGQKSYLCQRKVEFQIEPEELINKSSRMYFWSSEIGFRFAISGYAS